MTPQEKKIQNIMSQWKNNLISEDEVQDKILAINPSIKEVTTIPYTKGVYVIILMNRKIKKYYIGARTYAPKGSLILRSVNN